MAGLLLILCTIFLRCSAVSIKNFNYETHLVDFHWQKDFPVLTDVARARNLVFINAEIEMFSPQMSDQLKRCNDLSFRGGTVKAVQVKSTLTRLELAKTMTEDVIIDQGNSYKLTKLSVTNCHLTSIPENFNELKELEVLKISHNRIEYLSMDQFRGMDKLKTVDFDSNRIKYVLTAAESISLPLLQEFRMNNNQLYELDLCSWNMPNLDSLGLQSNKLSYVIGISTTYFPKIGYFDLGGNPLNCRWKEAFEKFVEERDWFLSDNIYCDVSNQDTVPSDCKLTRALNSKFRAWTNVIEATNRAKIRGMRNRLTALSSEVETIGANFSSISDKMTNLDGNFEAKTNVKIEELNSRLGAMEKKLVKQIAKQGSVIDDLVELVYRMEIERMYRKSDKN